MPSHARARRGPRRGDDAVRQSFGLGNLRRQRSFRHDGVLHLVRHAHGPDRGAPLAAGRARAPGDAPGEARDHPGGDLHAHPRRRADARHAHLAQRPGRPRADDLAPVRHGGAARRRRTHPGLGAGPRGDRGRSRGEGGAQGLAEDTGGGDHRRSKLESRGRRLRRGEEPDILADEGSVRLDARQRLAAQPKSADALRRRGSVIGGTHRRRHRTRAGGKARARVLLLPARSREAVPLARDAQQRRRRRARGRRGGGQEGRRRRGRRGRRREAAPRTSRGQGARGAR